MSFLGNKLRIQGYNGRSPYSLSSAYANTVPLFNVDYPGQPWHRNYATWAASTPYSPPTAIATNHLISIQHSWYSTTGSAPYIIRWVIDDNISIYIDDVLVVASGIGGGNLGYYAEVWLTPGIRKLTIVADNNGGSVVAYGVIINDLHGNRVWDSRNYQANFSTLSASSKRLHRITNSGNITYSSFLTNSGVWVGTATDANVFPNQDHTVSRIFNVTTAAFYNYRIAADNRADIYLDNNYLGTAANNFGAGFVNVANVFMGTGRHVLRVEAINYYVGTANTWNINPASFAVEILHANTTLGDVYYNLANNTTNAASQQTINTLYGDYRPQNQSVTTLLNDVSGSGNHMNVANSPADSGNWLTFTGVSPFQFGFINRPYGAITNPRTFTLSVWFRTPTAGVKIIGFENTDGATNATSYDRHIYINSTGKLVFGVYTGGATTVTTTGNFNNNVWNHVVASNYYDGEAWRMEMYANKVFIGRTNATPTDYLGYWKLGGYKLSGWPNASDKFFAGSIGEVVIDTIRWSTTRIDSYYESKRSLYGV